MARWIGLAFAVLLLAASAGPARAAAYQFGTEDKITKIADLTVRGPSDESLYLGYRVRVYSVLLPVYLIDQGYVIGFADDNTRYIPLNAEKIAALQQQGQLPAPLPSYALSWGDRIYGTMLWMVLAGIAAIAGAIYLVNAAARRSESAPGGAAPLTVAAMAARRNRFVLVVLTLSMLPLLAIVWFAHGFWLTVLHGPRAADAAAIIAARAQGDDHTWFLLTEQPQDLDVSRQTTMRVPQQAQIQQTQFSLYVLPGSPGILFEAERPVRPAASAAAERIDLQPPVYAWISIRNPFDVSYARAREAAARLGHASLAPFMLSWSHTRPAVTRVGTAIVAAPVAVALLLLLRGLLVTLRGLRDPLRTPNVRYLLRSCRGAEGLDRLVREIDAQAAQANLSLASRGPLLLPSWLIVNAGMTFRLMSTEDVIWIAAYTATTRQFGIKTAVRGQINVVDRFGRTIMFRPADLDAGMRLIYSRAPWAVAGPAPEMEQAFGKGSAKPLGWLTHRRARAELVRHVDARRVAILTQAKTAPAGESRAAGRSA